MPLEPRLPRSRKGLKLALLAPLLLVLTSCAKVSGLGYKEGLSSVNDTSLPLWQAAWITAGIVGVFTAGLILWASIFHRKKNEEFPKQSWCGVCEEARLKDQGWFDYADSIAQWGWVCDGCLSKAIRSAGHTTFVADPVVTPEMRSEW